MHFPFFFIFIALLLAACGVKGPPMVVIRKEVIPQRLDCSPYEADCDATDPDYVPGLDPTSPKDAAKIRELEAKAAAKKAAAAKK